MVTHEPLNHCTSH